MTLTPNPENDFKEWQGDVSTFPFTTLHFVYMTGNKNVTAVFKPRYSLTLYLQGKIDGDSVYVNSAQQTELSTTYSINEGDHVTLNPDPDPRFKEWQGALTGDDNPATITMYGNTNIAAVFKPQYTLTVAFENAITGDSVYINDTQQTALSTTYTFNEGDQVTLNPDPDLRFKQWQGSLTGTDNPASITMYSNKTITAVFKPRYTLTLNILYAQSGDSVKVNNTTQTASSASYPFNENDSVTLDPAIDAHFKQWQGDLTGDDNPATFSMTANKTITAVFKQLFNLTLTIQNPGTNRTVALGCTGFSATQTQGTESYAILEGNTVYLAAYIANQFKEWQGCTGNGNLASILMDGPKSVTAVFKPIYDLTVNTEGNGEVTVVKGSTTLEPDGNVYHLLEGGQVTLTAAPIPPSRIDNMPHFKTRVPEYLKRCNQFPNIREVFPPYVHPPIFCQIIGHPGLQRDNPRHVLGYSTQSGGSPSAGKSLSIGGYSFGEVEPQLIGVVIGAGAPGDSFKVCKGSCGIAPFLLIQPKGFHLIIIRRFLPRVNGWSPPLGVP